MKTSRRGPPPRNTAAKKAADRERQVVDLWLQRPKRERTPDDVERFYSWLMQHEPALVPNGAGSYRQLMDILKAHLAE